MWVIKCSRARLLITNCLKVSCYSRATNVLGNSHGIEERLYLKGLVNEQYVYVP